MRRTSPNGAKSAGRGAPHSPVIPSDARRNACLQEHSDEAAHEPHRGEVSEARNPLARDRLQQTGRSLTFVRDDV